MKGLILSVGLVASLLLCGVDVSAQQRKGDEQYRTRLIPYPTQAAATEGAMTRQKYMQPIDEWVDTNGVLTGEFTYPFSWLERQIFIRVEGVAQPYEIFINGKRAGGSTNGFGAAEYNITKISKEDKNMVELRMLDGEEVSKIECFDHGTPRPVAYIISQPRVRVRDIAYRANIDYGVVNADFSVVMHNETLNKKVSRLYYELFLNDTLRLDAGTRDVELGLLGVDTMRFGAPVPDSLLWSSDAPIHLSLRLKNRIEGRDVEFYNVAVALRKIEYKEGSFYVNNKPCEMNWSDVSPNATTDDIEQLYNNGIRAVRFTAGAVKDEVLSFCDAKGIYVAITAPINSSKSGESRKRGGNPSNDPKWRKEYVERTKQMINTTKRHPSVVAYYLADDSANGICLYESYLAAKKITDIPVFYDDGGNEWNSDNREFR